MAFVTLKKEIPVIQGYDVAVCGGGPAGLIAAIAAARTGARVCLIERYGFLGGAATAALVDPISVFKSNGQAVIRGIAWEFVERLSLEGGAITDYENGNVPIDAERYKLIAQRMVLEAGVALYLHSYISDALSEDGRISHIIISNKSGMSAIGARYVIDCTGDADLCRLAGVPMLESPAREELQPASLGFRVGGVDLTQIFGLHPRTPNAKFQMTAVREILSDLSARNQERVPNFGGPWFCTVLNDSAGIVNVNMTRRAADAVDGQSLSETECALREDVFAHFRLLKKYVPAFRDSYLIMTAPQVGFRESRRIRGRHVLSADEYVSTFRFEDSVARGAHPIDRHRATDSGQDVAFLRQAGYIPYRCMTADGFPNLLVAGRCISADREVFASIRVQATAMALGHAAGTAAAMCAAKACAVYELNTDELQRRLLADGAIL